LFIEHLAEPVSGATSNKNGKWKMENGKWKMTNAKGAGKSNGNDG
jgi:hypothetical protein